MAYDVNKKVTAEDLETSLDRAKEYADSKSMETAADVLEQANAYSDAAVSALDTRVTANETAIATLNGTGEGSVTKTVTDKVAEIVADAPEDLDTLKEMSDWISNHSESAAAMNSSINSNAAEIAEVKTELSEKADLSDIPTSLPADGGNAETAEKLETARTINGVPFDGSEDIKIDAVTTNTYNCSFKTSLSKLLIEISMVGADPTASHNLIIDGVSEQARTSRASAYFQIVINVTGTLSTAFDAECICTNASKMPVLKYVADLDSGKLQLYVTAANSALDFNYRVFIQSTRNMTIPIQNVIKNEDVDEIPVNAVDLPIEEYAYLNNVKELQNEVSDLKAYIGYTDSDIYGLEADFENNVFTRLAGAVGKGPGADFDGIKAFGGRRRCAVANDGTVVAYYGDDNYEEDGLINSTETLIQTMVEQPKFYYKVVPLKTEKIEGTDGYHLRKARYYISDTPKAGFKVHPAFVQNGIEVERIYLSAYEGCGYSVTSKAYRRDDQQNLSFDSDYLSSIKNAKPASGTTQALTRANARKLAQNRGAGWGITTIQTLSATQLLFAIEYATFNSQSAIGNGVVNATETIKTGSTSSLGNVSGSVASGGVSYRGEENLWGNSSAWVDNIDIQNPTTWSTSQNPGNLPGKILIDDKKIEIPSIYGSGYISVFGYSESSDWLFIPTELNGNSAIPIGDTLWNKNNVNRALTAGGYMTGDADVGLFAVRFNYMPTSHVKDIGARLIYIPPVEGVISE